MSAMRLAMRALPYVAIIVGAATTGYIALKDTMAELN